MTFDQAAERYRNDPTFKVIVDNMTMVIEDLHMSPGELRQAAVFAEFMFEQKRPMVVRTFRVDERGHLHDGH